LELWGEHSIERLLDVAKRRGVKMTWVVKEAFLDDPKVRARVERARSRGHKVEIDPSPPKRTLIFFGSAKGGGKGRGRR
jgi:hypothetical protein